MTKQQEKNVPVFSVKMRASRSVSGRNVHISGAEKLIGASGIDACADLLVRRALTHENGRPDFINVKIQTVNEGDILRVPALAVTERNTGTPEEAYGEIAKELAKLGISDIAGVFDRLKETGPMRGALLLDVATFERVEPDKERGIRATFMDCEKADAHSDKNHFTEALVLSTKVANAPHIIGEICVSDDLYYTTGYFASKQAGYVRLPNIKKAGDAFGGRVFLYNGKTSEDLKETIDFIENRPVLVTGVEDITADDDRYAGIRRTVGTLKEKNLYRTQSTITDVDDVSAVIGGKKYRMFASNNYLGLANDKKIKATAAKMAARYGAGSSGSRLINGNFDLHDRLEQAIARFKGAEAALVYNSGYCANVGVLSAVFAEGDVIFSDELNHASIIDGCRLSRARTVIYKHNDLSDLEEKIASVSFRRGVIVSDAVFSMDGDIADLPGILKVAKKHNLFTYIDEAHSTGVLGKTGRGICEHYGCEHPDMLMGTLSKAIGSEGGYVCGSALLIDYLRNTSRSYIFSTALSAAPIAAATKSVERLEKDPSLVASLHENIKFFNRCLKKAGIHAASETPIFSVVIGDEEKAMALAKTLNDKGFFIKAIRYPTVARGQARLRITLSAVTRRKDMKKLCAFLSEHV